MASRQIIQQENREAAVAGRVNKQKNMAAEKKSRRALNDIGNRVTIPTVDGKLLPQVSRPVTRSFCAQLLANVQAAAAENKKNAMAVNVNGGIAVDGAFPKALEKKPAQKKATMKAKPKPEIISVSSDSEQEKKEKKPVPAEKMAEQHSLKKKAPTLTSTLTARSKAACGLDYKRKEQILYIDAADVNNELAVVEYVEELYKFYKLVENESRVHDYIDSQPEINEKMRAILVDWLIQVHHKFELSPETLYLTINIVDRYLTVKTTARRELQLLGMSSMLIASKYEEIWAPEVNDFVCISDRAYTNEQVLRMEKLILAELEWNLTVPTPYMFLVRFIKAALPDPSAGTSRLDYEPYKVENMVYFLAELGLMNYATVIYSPSMVAASAVYAARCTLNKTPLWTETLKLHTGFAEQQLIDCARLLVSYHSAAAENKLKVIYRKYSSAERGAVALLPPAQSLFAAS